jgi:excisionase family DNA binding protein
MHITDMKGTPVLVELRLHNEDLELIARRVAELLNSAQGIGDRWLNVGQAATHLGLSENSVRALVKRQQIPFRRTPNHRLRFSVNELDHWVRTGSCAVTTEDLP